MAGVWATRDLPVLVAIVRAFAHDPFRQVRPEDLVEPTGLSHDEIAGALTNLASGSPRFFEGITISEAPFPVAITSVTERALRATGEWPDPEQLVLTLIAALEDAALREADPENKGRLEQAAHTLRSIALQIAIAWAAGSLPHP